MPDLESYETRFFLPRPRREVFDFFADARNLDRLTPGWLRFVIASPEPPIEMQEGTRIAYRFRWRFLPLPWQSVVTEWRPPERFTYEQARGPYRFWRHEHVYEEEDGGTRVIDRVEWRTHLGPLAKPFVRRDVEKIFEHRNRAAAKIFEAHHSG